MIDDQIGYQVDILAQFLDVCPASKTGIDLRVINGIEAGICSMNRIIEGEKMDAAKQASQWTCKASVQRLDVASAQAIYISNELHLVLHAVGSYKPLMNWKT